MHRKDDWVKPRGTGNFLTPEEINLLRISFKAGHSSREAARAIKCASRTASKYYAQFRLVADQPKRQRLDPSRDQPRAIDC